MSANINDIKQWLETGKEKGATHVIVALDTWDYSNYPVYVLTKDDVKEKVREFDSKQDRIDEVYNLSMDIEQQLGARRAKNY